MTDHDHDSALPPDEAPFRELLALRLYGELDDEDRADLEQRLADSPTLRAYADELAAGLGSLVPDEAPAAGPEESASVEPPPAWRQRLANRIEAETLVEKSAAAPATVSRPSIATWAAAVTGFAAGVLVMLGLGEPRETPRDEAAPLVVETPAEGPEPAPSFALPEPPPPSGARGAVTQLGLYLRK